MNNRIRALLFITDLLVALTAVGGGIALIVGLETGRFPADWLEGTPFSSYVLPGVILAGVVGGSATLAALSLLRSPTGGGASVLAGVIMMGWIIAEILLLKQPSEPTWTEVFYFALGLVMALLGWLVGRGQQTEVGHDEDPGNL